MPYALQASATGGFSAALVSAVLKAFDQPISPSTLCQELQVPPDFHWTSLLLGIFIGLILGQVLEAFILARHYIAVHLRQRCWALTNALTIKQRSG